MVLLLGAAPAWAGVGPAGITSDNVTHLKNIPRHADSSGARKLGNFFYITTGRDVAIYDVSTPEDPELVGELMLPAVAEPAFAEEDVDTNGEILLVENQGTLFVIDVVDKANPVVKSQLNDADVHTISCVLDCRYAYGNNGKIFDLTDPADPKLAMVNWEEKFPTESTHDVTEVAPGVILTASQPMMLLDARTTPLDPTLTRAAPQEDGRFVHATRWPRQAQDKFMLIGGEAIGPGCSGGQSSTFSTWNAATFHEIDEYRVTPDASGTTAPDSSYCTHWFQEHPRYNDGGLVSISWYEHGTRFLRIGADGQISEEGFFLPTGLPVAGQASAAYWISDRVVYVADYLRGLDVLRFEGDVGTDPAPPPPGTGGNGGSGGNGGAGTGDGTDGGGSGQTGSGPATGQRPARRKLSEYVYLPRMSNCVERRGLRIGLRPRPPERLRAVAVYVNGRRVGYFRGARLRSRLRVRLPNLPGMVVRVAVRTRSGRLVSNLRSYRSCGARPATVVPAGAVDPARSGVTRYGALCYIRAKQAAG